MMLGFLLARSGMSVVVLEKHADFFRDFRGDTIHPSTLELMHELGLLPAFLARPHQELQEVGGQIGDRLIRLADFTHLPTTCKFIAFMPQWDFLNFIAEHAGRYPTFELRMNAEVHDLIRDGKRVVGVRATTPLGPLDVRADLVVGADGRASIVRDRAGLEVVRLGVPIDVLWFRVPKQRDDPGQMVGRVNYGKIMVMIGREDYWQCGFVIRKGAFEEIQRDGLAAFREDIVSLAPFVRERVGALGDWSDVKLLTVSVDRLRQWYLPGLLCIGDAAHAMSPIGGVGINLAVQDAVAAANILVPRMFRSKIATSTLRDVQRRRAFPAYVMQRVQVFIQNRAIAPVLRDDRKIRLPFLLRVVGRSPLLRRIPGRVIGMGFRPEHIRTIETRTP